jgi:hypothetical protein
LTQGLLAETEPIICIGPKVPPPIAPVQSPVNGRYGEAEGDHPDTTKSQRTVPPKELHERPLATSLNRRKP